LILIPCVHYIATKNQVWYTNLHGIGTFYIPIYYKKFRTRFWISIPVVWLEVRINYGELEPGAVKAVYALKEYVKGTGLEPSLISLIEIRASQINGCAYCLDMHTTDAMAEGESEQRIFCLSAWRESPFYTERERAAMEFTEAVTAISLNGVSDHLYKRVRKSFSEREYIALIMAINTINCWNRLSIACGHTAGMYVRKKAKS